MRRMPNNNLEIMIMALLVSRKNPALSTTSAFGYDLEKKNILGVYQSSC